MNFGEYFKQYDALPQDLKRDIKWLGCSYLNCSLYDLDKQTLDAKTIKKIQRGIARLKNNEPLSYITQSAPFFGSNFYVNSNVLIPRMETELLVDWIIKENRSKHNLHILDMCTGSGCIAIILKQELDCTITAVDKSSDALLVAQKNAQMHNVQINFVQSDMFDKISTQYDIIVSNPPYIPSNQLLSLDKNIRDYEPKLALDGGKDGLDYYHIIAQQAPRCLKQHDTLYLEIGYDQGASVPHLLQKDFDNIIVKKDYDNNDRMIKCTRR